MYLIRREVLQIYLLGLALLQVRNTLILALKGTVRTNITRTTTLRITETGIGLGTNL
jgi:hypothetical protein